MERSAGNNGPPGAVLLPDGSWQKYIPRKRPTTALLRDKGFFLREPDHTMESQRSYLPSNTLEGLVYDRFRPLTALLASKGPAAQPQSQMMSSNGGGGQTSL